MKLLARFSFAHGGKDATPEWPFTREEIKNGNWQREPAAEYLEAIGEKRSSYGTHHENVKVGQELGLKPVYTLASNQDDWDKWTFQSPNEPNPCQASSEMSGP